MTDATQSGAPTDKLPEADADKKDAPSARELAMNAIAAGNMEKIDAEHIEQTGRSLYNASQLDAQLETPAEPPDEPIAAKTDISDDAVVQIKVDGEERTVTVAEMKRRYQKNEAADRRLAEATRLLEQAKLTAQPPIGFDPPPPSGKTQSSDSQPDGSGGLEQGKELVSALFEGDEEKAAAAVSKILSGRSNPTLDIGQLTAQLTPAIKQQLVVESALEKFGENFAEIVADPYLASIADGYLEQEQADPEKSYAEALTAAGNRTRDWLKSKGVVTTQADPTIDRKAKLERKEGMDRLPALQTRAKTNEEPEMSRSDVIAQMQKARGLGV